MHIRLQGKSPATVCTLERTQLQVIRLVMGREATGALKHLVAEVTRKRPLTGVSQRVLIQVASPNERFMTDFAGELQN